MKLEFFLFRVSRGLMSRWRVLIYRILGMKLGAKNRFERGRIRRLDQIEVGSENAFSEGYWLWPEDSTSNRVRIKIGDGNYFNRNVLIDACGYVELGNENMVGPDVCIIDSNHTFGLGKSPKWEPMQKGKVRIGNHCWIGAKAVLLKDVELGDGCVVGAGAVVTKSFPAGSVIAGVPAREIHRGAAIHGFT